MRILAICAVFAGLLMGCGQGEAKSGNGDGAASGQVIKFTAIPDDNTTELREKYEPVAKYLSEATGLTFEYVAAADYSASVDMFKNGDVHLAWFGGLTGCQARAAVGGARAIAQGAEDPKYYSYFIAHKDVPLERGNEFPQGIASYKFTFGSNSSTSGRLMPEFFVRQATGKTPAEFFGEEPGFSGSHDKTDELVNAGTYQVGAINYKTYEGRVKEGKSPNTKILWKTPYYADYNFTAHPGIDEMHGAGTIDKIQAAILAMDPEMAQRAFRRSKMIPAKNEEFEGIADTARTIGLMR